MNNIYTQFLVDNDACDTSTPLQVIGRQDVPDSDTYTVDIPMFARKTWLVAMSVNVTFIDKQSNNGSVLYITNLRSDKHNTSTPNVPIYYISRGIHHVNLETPLLVGDQLKFSSKFQTKVVKSRPTPIAIPLVNYTFYFLRNNFDYCTGYELCSSLVTMYTETYQSVRTKCKNVDAAAMQVKYGMCDSKYG